MRYKEFDIPLDLQDDNSPYSKVDEDVVYITLDLDKPKRKARNGSRLSHQEKELFTTFLQVNKDVCTMSAIYMPIIDSLIIYHHVYVYPTIKSVVQQKSNLEMKRSKITKVETNKLKDANFINKVYHLEWLANVVFMHKKNGKWKDLC